MPVLSVPAISPHHVRRPLTAAELEYVGWRINRSPDLPTLLHSVAAAVFDALLADLNDTYDSHGPSRPLDRRQIAIPQTQWTAIATAMTDRAHLWGSTIELGLELGNVMPSSYDDPDVAAPHLTPGDGRPHMMRLQVSREAAEEIAACEAHIQALADTYGSSSARHHDASASWRRQLAALFTIPWGSRAVVHRDGPFALRVSAEDGSGVSVIFHGEQRHCTVAGCHATTDAGTRWRPASADTGALHHTHEPSFPFDAPQPGSWSSQPWTPSTR
ncbi:hypothetical protein J2S43_001107 [Catenuloplanes nepalensis]|uniref:Uncharacterized protein n=1 Tax=Catenuloplanes nepalensis TaxID=587533 RepID=A0ABT9MMH4_9ACTN|nr:hypothetical protein [Catenuloplanes nepalensis]MDP9792595.1 hypothetical protein [Catenuloplanes nepalensis]